MTSESLNRDRSVELDDAVLNDGDLPCRGCHRVIPI